jgi:hypothetical protein
MWRLIVAAVVLTSSIVWAEPPAGGQENEHALRLQIIDSAGKKTVIRDAANTEGKRRPAAEVNGITFEKGDAEVFVEWSSIDKIVIAEQKSNEGKRNAEVHLVVGKKESLVWLDDPAGTITGKSDIGDYRIEHSKIRSIEVLRGE